jgi:hypothetical protein
LTPESRARAALMDCSRASASGLLRIWERSLIAERLASIVRFAGVVVVPVEELLDVVLDENLPSPGYGTPLAGVLCITWLGLVVVVMFEGSLSGFTGSPLPSVTGECSSPLAGLASDVEDRC